MKSTLKLQLKTSISSSMMHVNTHSLLANFEKFKTMLMSIHDTFSVIAISETWLKIMKLIEANRIVGYIENQFFNQYNGPQPKLHRRYIDDCVDTTSSTREELEQFINSVNKCHPALKYTWQILETSIAFLDINVSIQNNGLSTSVYYKPIDYHSYLLHSSSHPNHNSIRFSQFLRLRRLCSDELDFSNKSEEMLQFFKNRGYPDSVVKTAQERAQTTNQHSAPQTTQKEENQRITFTLTFHPLNLPVKNIILQNFKLLQNENETSKIFSLSPLISFKRNKNISDLLVTSTLNSDKSAGTFNCTRKRCKTCPFIIVNRAFIHNTDKVTGPKRSIKIMHFLQCYLLHKMHLMEEDIHRRGEEE